MFFDVSLDISFSQLLMPFQFQFCEVDGREIKKSWSENDEAHFDMIECFEDFMIKFRISFGLLFYNKQ